MGTKWSEIITDYAMVEINDDRLNEKLSENPALFFRTMSLYMKNGIPRFTEPPEEKQWLTYMPPICDSFECKVEQDVTTVQTGKIKFDLCCVEVISEDRYENPVATPLAGAAYDSETGVVTLPSGLAVGSALSMDFYTDGEFENILSLDEKRILGLCVQIVWENRYIGTWLDRVSKVKDKTFDIGSESNQTRANTDRMRMLDGKLSGEMHKYAQNLRYRQIVPQNRQLKRP